VVLSGAGSKGERVQQQKDLALLDDAYGMRDVVLASPAGASLAPAQLSVVRGPLKDPLDNCEDQVAAAPPYSRASTGILAPWRTCATP